MKELVNDRGIDIPRNISGPYLFEERFARQRELCGRVGVYGCQGMPVRPPIRRSPSV